MGRVDKKGEGEVVQLGHKVELPASDARVVGVFLEAVRGLVDDELKRVCSGRPEAVAAVGFAVAGMVMGVSVGTGFRESVADEIVAEANKIPAEEHGKRLGAWLDYQEISIEQLLGEIGLGNNRQNIESWRGFLNGKGRRGDKRRHKGLLFVLPRDVYRYVFYGDDMPDCRISLTKLDRGTRVQEYFEDECEKIGDSFGLRCEVLLFALDMTQQKFGSLTYHLTGNDRMVTIGSWISSRRSSMDGIQGASVRALEKVFTRGAMNFLRNGGDSLPRTILTREAEERVNC